MPSLSLSTTKSRTRTLPLPSLSPNPTAFLPHLHTFLHTSLPLLSQLIFHHHAPSLPTRPPLFFVFHSIMFSDRSIEDSAFAQRAASLPHSAARHFLLPHRALLSLLFTDNTTRGRYVLIAVCCLCVAPPPGCQSEWSAALFQSLSTFWLVRGIRIVMWVSVLAYGHTQVNIPYPVRFAKSSICGLGQY